MSVQQQSIQPFTKPEYDQLTKEFEDNAVRIDLPDLNILNVLL